MKNTYTLKAIPAGSRYPLINDGKLEIVPIGVGSMLAVRRFNTNFLLVKGDTHLLIDCGRTAPEALASIGVAKEDVTNILPTHAHDDHVGGIGTLAIANRYVGRARMGKPKITLIAPSCFAITLWEDTLKGNLRINDPMNGPHAPEFSDWFELVEPKMVTGSRVELRETYFLNFKGIALQVFRTMHVPATAESWSDSAWSTGVLIDNKVFISGDSRFDPELIRSYASEADLVFHDAALFKDPVHASIEELHTLPADIRSKIHPIHYGDNWVEHSDEGFAGWAEQGVRYVMS